MPIYEQHLAIREIVRLGGDVETEPGGPQWLRDQIGDERMQVTDAGLECLKGITNLRILCLSNTRVTDAGLIHLSGLTKLRRLDLSFTKVTDAGIVHLTKLPNLHCLEALSTDVTKPTVSKLLPEVN
ncbi:MAG TPA: leucine-rich repeat domain-containing protein, partial [Planctomycetaceae bacterium]